jgi:hypothetical protein
MWGFFFLGRTWISRKYTSMGRGLVSCLATTTLWTTTIKGTAHIHFLHDRVLARCLCCRSRHFCVLWRGFLEKKIRLSLWMRNFESNVIYLLLTDKFQLHLDLGSAVFFISFLSTKFIKDTWQHTKKFRFTKWGKKIYVSLNMYLDINPCLILYYEQYVYQ